MYGKKIIGVNEPRNIDVKLVVFRYLCLTC